MNERHDEIDDAIVVEGRLYLLTANAGCWKCGQLQDVVAIAAQGLSEGGEPIPDTQDPGSLIILRAVCRITPIPASVEHFLVIIISFQSQAVLSSRKIVPRRQALK